MPPIRKSVRSISSTTVNVLVIAANHKRKRPGASYVTCCGGGDGAGSQLRVDACPLPGLEADTLVAELFGRQQLHGGTRDGTSDCPVRCLRETRDAVDHLDFQPDGAYPNCFEPPVATGTFPALAGMQTCWGGRWSSAGKIFFLCTLNFFCLFARCLGGTLNGFGGKKKTSHLFISVCVRNERHHPRSFVTPALFSGFRKSA